MSSKELEEAIETLRGDIEHPTAKFMPDLLKAQRLGIEALEFVKKGRDYPEFPSCLLPSESEEEK